MRLILICLLTISASLLVWEGFQHQTSEVPPENSPKRETTPPTTQTDSPKALSSLNNSPVQLQAEDKASLHLLNKDEASPQVLEYWHALLSNDHYWDSPALRADLAREIHYLSNLDVDDSIALWELLQQMPTEFASEKDTIATAIINNVAMRDPLEAVSMLLSSEEEYRDLDYPMIVRLWMDKEGPSIMEWFGEMDALDANEHLQQAFYQVYAEEDPQGLLTQYSHQADQKSISSAIDAIYSQYGINTLNQLAIYSVPPSIMESAFTQTTDALLAENTEKAQQFLLTNRFQVPESSVSSAAKRYLQHELAQGGESLETAMNWTLNNSLVQPESPEITSILSQAWTQDPDLAAHLIDTLVNRTGSMTSEWAAVLDGSNQLQPFTVTADNIDSANTGEKDPDQMAEEFTELTKQFLQDVGLEDAQLTINGETITIEANPEDEQNQQAVIQQMFQEAFGQTP